MGIGNFISLIILAVVIWIEVYIAKQFYEVAREKGYHYKKYFWICFLLPVVGYLLVVALPDRGNRIPTFSDELPDL